MASSKNGGVIVVHKDRFVLIKQLLPLGFVLILGLTLIFGSGSVSGDTRPEDPIEVTLLSSVPSLSRTLGWVIVISVFFVGVVTYLRWHLDRVTIVGGRVIFKPHPFSLTKKSVNVGWDDHEFRQTPSEYFRNVGAIECKKMNGEVLRIRSLENFREVEKAFIYGNQLAQTSSIESASRGPSFGGIVRLVFLLLIVIAGIIVLRGLWHLVEPQEERVLRAAYMTSVIPPPVLPGVSEVTPVSPVEQERDTSPTVALPVCRNIVNEGDKGGSSGWVPGKTPRPAVYLDNGHMRLGISSGADVRSYSSMYQQLTIPSDASRVVLSFRYFPHSNDINGGDKFHALIFDTNWTLLDPVFNFQSSTPEANAQEWASTTYDLMPFARRSIRIYFNVINDGDGLLSSMEVRDVSVLVCR